jgi:hypothetical protein
MVCAIQDEDSSAIYPAQERAYLDPVGLRKLESTAANKVSLFDQAPSDFAQQRRFATAMRTQDHASKPQPEGLPQ